MNKIQTFLAPLYIILFLTPFGLMATNSTPLDIKKFEQREFRYPAEFPNITLQKTSLKDLLSALQAWPAQFDNWLNDHYPFRHALLSGNKHLEKLLAIKKSNQLDGKVIVGKNNRLFLGDTYGKVMSQHTGSGFQMSKTSLAPIVEKMANGHHWLHQNKSSFIIFITPDKHTIYPEDLPAWLTPYYGKTSADTFIELAHQKELMVLYPKAFLQENKKEYGPYLYHNTDSHWTNLGAYLAYTRLMRHIAEKTSSVKSLQLKTYNVLPTNEKNDLARLAGLTQTNGFSISLTFTKEFSDLTATDFNQRVQQFANTDRVLTHEDRIITNPRALNNLTLLIFRDSFAAALSPLLNQTFSRVIYTTNDNYRQYKQLVQNYHPDITIFQNVERGIPFLDI